MFVVATANDISKLPPELLRRGRFDEIFFVDLPNEEERKEILTLYAKRYLNTSFSDTLLSNAVSLTEGFAGADLESAMRDIAYRLIANDSLSPTEDFVRNALENVIPLSKTSPEKILSIQEWGRERAVPASGRPIGGENTDAAKTSRRVLV